ncbi:MAG: hypothetical protein KatS3mg039_1567 [Candidatus Kapaibacterium sp.]|nr:MAG: hypothetical protein KatS3mg039_1567 [Candidatus Kapabacteria bacterium]
MKRLLAVLVVLAACAPPPPPPAEQLDAKLAWLPLASEEELRSPDGDLLLPLPEGWTLLPPSRDLAEGTIGLALNPDLTMSVVIQRIFPTEALAAALDTRDIRALARVCFERRLQRTGNTIRLTSNFGAIGRDSLRMGTYEFVEQSTDTATVRRTRVAVVPTASSNVYEVALSPIMLSLDRIPDERRLDSAFRFMLQILRVP